MPPTVRALSAAAAAALDRDLFARPHAYSPDQLLELAGLAVAQAVHRAYPPALAPATAAAAAAAAASVAPAVPTAPSPRRTRVLVACGPGNNGGDGLVAARHLFLFGYAPSVWYPRPGRADIYQRLVGQLAALPVRFVAPDDPAAFDAAAADADIIVDAILGFGAAGALRAPFAAAVAAMNRSEAPVVSVDAPSGWGVDAGPADADDAAPLRPAVLVSLTAPKPLARHFRPDRGARRHFLAGRFLPPAVAEKYGLGPGPAGLPPYPGADQIVELPVPVDVQVAPEPAEKL